MTNAQLKGTLFWIPVLILSVLTLTGLVWLDVRPKPTIFELAGEGDLDALQKMIDHGVLLEEPDRDGLTPLAHAVQGNQLEAVERLLAAGADVNAQSVDGNTALRYAVENDFSSVISCLLDAGADPHLQNDFGESPFFKAVDGNRSSVSLFLQRGIIPDETRAPERDGYFFCAARSGCIPVLQQMLKDVPDVNELSPLGMSALHCAVYADNLEATHLLIEHGANVNLCDRHHWSPLHQAVRSGDKELVCLLVEHGADLEACDLEGCTPFLTAVDEGRVELVKELADLGANIDAENKGNKSAEDLAMTGNHVEILVFLREYREKLLHKGKGEQIFF
ncbi:ankyrin repeat domain-containing protein [Tichowtungia aerotolerans]|uniref:Uncharacterized protein n=1 Tax=Tichowtungia aerotolerans TaxID=2697043 RepID=A0A6P1MDC9_9BACT|nr:ankyrin repeat domain-containing protein [Tichowtungia aerotolerans]QHI69596.1 hypothetical protein GT409_09045 [Tichowtungia aerotolerans]